MVKPIKPISPSEVGAAKRQYIPDAVFEVFNTLIALEFCNGSATVKQPDVVRMLIEKHGMSRNEIFSKGYLNVESAYEAEGWTVDYDKPGYNESYDASFEFKVPKKVLG